MVLVTRRGGPKCSQAARADIQRFEVECWLWRSLERRRFVRFEELLFAERFGFGHWTLSVALPVSAPRTALIVTVPDASPVATPREPLALLMLA